MSHPLPALALLAALLPLQTAADISVSAATFDNLGITLGQPRSVASVGALEARARVLLPPDAEYLVSAPVSGVVQRVFTFAGDTVAAGAPLAELASAEFAAWQRDFLAAHAEHRLQQQFLARDRQLLDEGIIPQRRLDETQARATAALAARNQATLQLRLTGLDDAALATLAQSGQAVAALTLRAPLAGVVMLAAAASGERVDALTPVFRIGDPAQLWLEVQMPAERLGLVQAGQALALASAPGTAVAEVTAIGQMVDPATQLAQLRARVTRLDSTLRPGAFVTVRLLEAADGAVAVPAAAIAHAGDQAVVFLHHAQGFTPVPVSVLGSDGELRFVRGAIDPQSTVAVRGAAALKALWLADED